MPTAMCITENGKMIKQTEMANTPIQMVQNTKANGNQINNMGKEKKAGLMEPSIKAHISTAKSTGKESLNGLTNLTI